MMAEREYIERAALLAEYDRVHVGPPGGARRMIEDAPADEMITAIADGLRHVALPGGMPMKIGVVLEYAGTTVRHEFVPRVSGREGGAKT